MAYDPNPAPLDGWPGKGRGNVADGPSTEQAGPSIERRIDPDNPAVLRVVPITRQVCNADCHRCEQMHDLTFHPLAKPIGEWDWWAVCPVSREPVLVRFGDLPADAGKGVTP